MADFFEKFKDIKGEEKKIEEQLENKLIFKKNNINLLKILQKLQKGEKFEIEVLTENSEEYYKGDERLKRLGFCPHRSKSIPGQHHEIVYGFTNNYPEYMIVKYAENSQQMDRILNPKFQELIPEEDAYLFLALLKNQKSPIRDEQAKYLKNIARHSHRTESYFLMKTLVDELNQFAKEKNLDIKFNHKNKRFIRHDELHIDYKQLEQDAQERADIILQLVEKDKLLSNTCKRCGTRNPDKFFEHTWFSILDGVASTFETLYGSERAPMIRYLVLDKLSDKFGMPRNFVDSRIDDMTRVYFGRGGIDLAAIINRAYRIESGRKPLEL